jgi:hypothetical protein
VNKSSLTSFHLSSHSRKSPPSLAIPPENPAHGNSMHMRDNAYILGRAGVRKLRCSFDRCTNQVQQGGLCIRHGAIVTRYKSRRCSFDGRTNQVQQGGLCISHDASIIRCSHEPLQKGRCRRHGAKLLKNAVGRLL